MSVGGPELSPSPQPGWEGQEHPPPRGPPPITGTRTGTSRAWSRILACWQMAGGRPVATGGQQESGRLERERRRGITRERGEGKRVRLLEVRLRCKTGVGREKRKTGIERKTSNRKEYCVVLLHYTWLTCFNSSGSSVDRCVNYPCTKNTDGPNEQTVLYSNSEMLCSVWRLMFLVHNV